MKPYKALDGTLLDLEHVIAIREPVQDRKYVEPYMFTVICAFGTDFIIAFDTSKEVTEAHEHLVNAWKNRDTQ